MHEADYIVIADGSGINKAGAWAALVKPRDAPEIILSGFVSHTTINVMELMPFLHAFAFIERQTSGSPTIIAFSDSLYVVKCARRVFQPSANLWLWKALEHFKQRFTLTFEYLERCSTKEARLVDDLSRKLRVHVSSWLTEELKNAGGQNSTVGAS